MIGQDCTAGRPLREVQVSVIAARPRAQRRWKRSLRACILWVALALGILAVAHELDPAALSGAAAERTGANLPAPLVAAFLATVPFPPLLAGLTALVRTLRERSRGAAARSVADRLRATLPPDFVVLSPYLPRDSGDGEVDIVVFGPTGVFSVEVCDEPGDVVCYQDAWYSRGTETARRFIESPSRSARWHASRVRSDVSAAGFVRTPVDAVVVFTRARLLEVSSSSVPVVAGLDALASHLLARGEAASPQRARAIAHALAGNRRLAVAG